MYRQFLAYRHRANMLILASNFALYWSTFMLARSFLLRVNVLPLLAPFIFFTLLRNARAETSPPSLGLSIVLTGSWASWGIPVKNGLEMGLSESGAQFLLDAQDDRCEAKHALTNFTRFLGSQKQKITALGCLECVDAVAPLLNRYGAIMFSLGGMSTEVLEKYPRVVGLYSGADTEVRYLLPYIERHHQSLVAVTHNGLYGEIFGDSLEALAPKTMVKLLARERVPLDEVDFHSLISRLVSRKAEAVLVHISATSSGHFIKQLRNAGYKGAIYSTFTIETEDSRVSGGSALNGVVYTYPSFDAAGDLKFQEFATRYKSRFGVEANNSAAVAFDAGMLIGKAAQKCGANNADCILGEFSRPGRYDGVGGALIIDKGRLPLRPYGLKQLKDGSSQWIVRELSPVNF